jgi:hypothetical protein
MQSGDYQVERIAEEVNALSSNHPGAQPFWTLEQDALISPTPPFEVTPLDGSSPFNPQFPDGMSGTDFPMPNLSLWNMEDQQLIIHIFGGRSNMSGVWVFEFSDDLRSVDNYYRLGGLEAYEGNSDITLISWWEYGESILVSYGDVPEPRSLINDFWSPPRVWLLMDQSWVELSYQ